MITNKQTFIIGIIGLFLVAVIGLILILRDKPKQVQTLKIDTVESEHTTPESGYYWNNKTNKYEKIDGNNIKP